MFNIFLLIFPQIVLTASRAGLLLWFNNILPALLPFMVATNMLILLGFSDFLAGILAPVMKKVFGLPGAAGFGFLAGLTSGYPMGAKTVGDLHRAKKLSSDEAQRLLAFCNNAGPLFILGVVGVGMFGSTRVGYVLWAAHVFSALAVGVLYTKKGGVRGEFPAHATTNATTPSPLNPHSFGKVLGDAVNNSMEALLAVGGLIIFFSVVTAVFEAAFFDIGAFAGLIEVSSGVRRISEMPASPGVLAATGFVIAFGGFSVHAQSLHFLSGTGVSAGKYLFAKTLHGVLAAVFSVVFNAVAG